VTRKIRVLQVIDRIGNAGAETLQRTFAEALDRRRFELHVCGLRPRPGSITLPALQALGVPVLVLNQHTSYDLPALMALVRYIRRQRIDIIHTHLLAGDIMGRLAGFLTRRPVVSTIHNTRADLDEEPRRRQWLERQTAHLWCRRLVVVSELLREDVAAWFALPPERVMTIANAVDTERFARGPEFDRAAVKAALDVGAGPLIANVARLMPAKGQGYLLDAARIVVAARPDARFVLLGEGPLRAELEAQAATLGLTEHVRFAGFRPDVPDILAASDLFVLSSLWEGMPIALLEALAAGCAAVVTAVGGVGQVVQDGTTGLLVPPADPAALAAAILACLADPARARTLAAAGQAWVRQEYGMDAWARQWEALYLRELGQTR
jgi:glycosyltransferase involved in cell wall biosynthesis